MAEGLGREACGGGERDPRPAQRAADVADGGVQRLLALAAALDEQRRALTVDGQRGDLRAQPRHRLHLGAELERAAVEDLDGVDARLVAQHGGGVARVSDVGEDDEGRRLVPMVGHRLAGQGERWSRECMRCA